MVGDAGEREVQQLAAKPSDGAADRDRFVHVTSGPFGRAPIVKPELVVGIPVRGPYPAAEVPRDARDAVRRVVGIRHPGLNLFRQLRRHALVRIQGEDPVIGRDRRRKVFLVDIPGPRTADDPYGQMRGDSDRVVGALGIHDHDFVGPRDRFDRASDVDRFVLRDDRHREPRHGASVIEGTRGGKGRTGRKRRPGRAGWRDGRRAGRAGWRSGRYTTTLKT